VRFLAPVPSGSRVRARFRLLDLVEKRPGEWLETREMTVEIEGGERPALICEWMTLHVQRGGQQGGQHSGQQAGQ